MAVVVELGGVLTGGGFTGGGCSGGGFSGGGGRDGGVVVVGTGVTGFGICGAGIGGGTITGGFGTLGGGLEGVINVPGSGGDVVTLLKTTDSGMSYPRGMLSSKLVVKNAMPALPIPCIGPPFTFVHPSTGGAGR